MSGRQHSRKSGQPMVAVQFKRHTEGFKYTKCGEEQRCKTNDWLAESDGDVCIVYADSFARTYAAEGRGTYVKTGRVWTEQSPEASAHVGRLA